MSHEIWKKCLELLEREKDISTQQFIMLIRPLQVEIHNNDLVLYAPNRFVMEWVQKCYLKKIDKILKIINSDLRVSVELGSKKNFHYNQENNTRVVKVDVKKSKKTTPKKTVKAVNVELFPASSLNANFKIENYVEAKFNQLAYAAAKQVAEKPGVLYNPFVIYGGVGVGKTHLMHAIGHLLMQKNKNFKVAYMHSERFVAEMIRCLKTNAMNDFKKKCRKVDALLIDDVQFFAGKERTQEEFFHTFNTLLEEGKQIILTCDRYPAKIKKLEDNLRSRFGWGLTVEVEPPELEARIAILLKKAENANVELSYEVAYYIAETITSNVRELEGVLRRLIANAQFVGGGITINFVKNTLKDIFVTKEKNITLDNIQKAVATYFEVSIEDILSKKRTRNFTRPRQIAMSLSKDLTSLSFPEIGRFFGRRDHTTVLHACRAVKKNVSSDSNFREAYNELLKILTT